MVISRSFTGKLTEAACISDAVKSSLGPDTGPREPLCISCSPSSTAAPSQQPLPHSSTNPSPVLTHPLQLPFPRHMSSLTAAQDKALLLADGITTTACLSGTSAEGGSGRSSPRMHPVYREGPLQYPNSAPLDVQPDHSGYSTDDSDPSNMLACATSAPSPTGSLSGAMNLPGPDGGHDMGHDGAQVMAAINSAGMLARSCGKARKSGCTKGRIEE